MRRFLLLALFPVVALAAPASAPTAAEIPPVPQASANDEPEVRIVERKDAVVTEYRRHGKLYMMKVTPTIGESYYLIDKEGMGRFDRADMPANGRISVPHWVLFEF